MSTARPATIPVENRTLREQVAEHVAVVRFGRDALVALGAEQLRLLAAAAHAVRIPPMSASRKGSPPVTKISLTPSSAASWAIRRTRSRPSARRGALGEERTQQ